MLDFGRFIGYNGFTIKLLEVTAMLKTPELAMPRSRKVTTVYNGKREVWTDYEEAIYPRQKMALGYGKKEC